MLGKNETFNRTKARSIKLILLAEFICIFMTTMATSEVNNAKRQDSNSQGENNNDDQGENEGENDSCDVSGKQPHIVVVLIDDAGWNDVGWNNDFMPTPVLNELAYNGVILNNIYAQPLCTPSRIALLTGRYPANVGMQHFVVLPSQPYYLPSEYSTLGDKLKEVGYMNHVVGKWNIGSCNWTYTPLWRGFDSHYGCYEATTSDYESHILNWPRNQPPIFTGIDFRDNTGVVTHQNGTHNTFLFSERAEKIVRNHNPASPLFLYVAYMVPHFPIQVPAGFEESVQVDDANRKAYAGMMAAMDQGVGNITQALKDTGMWDDTLFVFLSDNGGDDVFAGSNYPYRGNKGSTFEGGMKVPAFFHGSMLQDPSTVNNELYHFTDVFATLVSVAGGELETDIDGVNQWDSICRGEPSKRSDILLHYDTHPDTTGLAYRMGDYKYIEGITTTWPFRRFSNDLFHFDQWFRPAENPSAPIPDAPFITEDENNRFLFNLKDDPLETNNLYYDPDEQNVVIEIEQRLEEYRANFSPIWYPGALDPRSDPAKFGGFWTPGWC